MKEPEALNSGDPGNQATQNHPSDQDLREFMTGRLDARKQHELELHIGECVACCEKLENLEDQPADDTLLSRLRQFDTSVDFAQSNSAQFQSGQPVIPDELVDHPRYEVLEHIGSGGMGQVFRARHRIMEKDVAIKIIKRQFMYDENAVKRFQKEIKAAAKLNHKNIVSSIDAEIEHDLNMLVMEYVPGKKLSEYVGRSNPLPIRHSCHFARQIAMGLQHGMEKGLTHRDIKPQNMLVVPDDGTIKIMDFGLAKFASESIGDDEESLTLEGESFGTPDYVAPEQIRDAKAADIRADIYSLGCSLYFMLTGQKPFPLGSIGEKLAAHLEKQAEPIDQIRPEVPRSLCAIVEKMMAKGLSHRYQTPNEVVEALTPWSKKNWQQTVGSVPSAVVAPIAGDDTNASAQKTIPENAKPKSTGGSPVVAPIVVAPIGAGHTRAPGEESAFDDSFALVDQPGSVDLPVAESVAPFAGQQFAQQAPDSTSFTPAARKKKKAVPLPAIIAAAVAGLLLFGVLGFFGIQSLLKSGDEPSPGPFAGGVRQKPRILVVVPARNAWHDEITDIKKFANRDDVDVVFASSRTGNINGVDSQENVKVSVESTLNFSDAKPENFDAVVFTGALLPDGGYDRRSQAFRGDVEYAFDGSLRQEAKKFIDSMLAADKVVTSVCGGNAVLILTGTLDGRKATPCKYIDDRVQNSTGQVKWNPNDNECWTEDSSGDSGIVITGREHKAYNFFEQVVTRAKQKYAK